jgi:hypothetical protein
MPSNQINWKNIALGVVASFFVSVTLGVGGAMLSAWNDIATLTLRVEHVERDNAALREWLRELSKRTAYYHGEDFPK